MPPPRQRSREYTYRTSLRWDGERRGTLSAEGLFDLPVATPPEFGGHEGAWTPEHLIVATVQSCLLTTFLYYTNRMGIELVSYSSEAEGLLEMAPDGAAFTRFHVKPRVVVASGDQVAAAREALDKAETACLITASVTGRVTAEGEVTAETD